MKTEREQRLKRLEAQKMAMTIVTDGQPLLEALSEKIHDLKSVFGAGVDLNVDDLIDQVAQIETISPAVERLKHAIESLEFPDYPDQIEVTGLDSVAEAIGKHIKYIKQLKSYKLPDPHVQVEIVDNQKISEVTSRLDDVIKAVEANTPGQSPDDYLPTRRVIKIGGPRGGRLQFDDDIYHFSGGGGSGPTTVQALHNPWQSLAKFDQKATVATISSSAGAFGGYMIANTNSNFVYLQVFDTTGAVTVGTTTPSKVFGIPPQASANVEFTNGILISNGIKLAVTTSATGSSAPGSGLDMTILYEAL